MEPIPDLVPNFVIEVLSSSNTYGEMSRKRREYFYAGVELLWMVEHPTRTVTLYRTSQDANCAEPEHEIKEARHECRASWKFR